MSKKFSIIIPTIRATTLVEECISSFIKFHPDGEKYEIIIVDDGSTPDVQQWLQEYCDRNQFMFIGKPDNRGFANSVNIGLERATGKYRVLVNNDIIFTSRIFENLEAAFERDKKIGIVGAKLSYPDGRIQHAGVIRLPGRNMFVHVNKHIPKDSKAVNVSKYFLSVTGALFAIREEAYREIGKFNENYFIACEDCEYCVRSWLTGWRVYYAHDVEAIHIEGFTRGNDDVSKRKKGPEWYVKEQQTFAKFFADMMKYDLRKFEQMANSLNGGDIAPKEVPSNVVSKSSTELIRLEVGCGYNPQPGYVHLDVRPLKDVEYVCDFSKDRLPFNDGAVGEVLANHVIEHISWRKLPFVVAEWSRVLAPGGKVFLRTPDLKFICQKYLEGGTTPEWPGDEDFIKKHLSAEITPAWWANIKLFAGQDYPSNFHYLCFDFEMLKALLERFGFVDVRRVDVQPVYSPGELQIAAFKQGESKVDPAGEVRMASRVLVKRKAALGDVLLTTPIVARLRGDLGHETIIHVATDCGSAYQNNPHVNSVIPSNSPTMGYDRIIDLDLAYEKNPKAHVIDAYSMVAFGDCDYDKSTVLVPSDVDHTRASELMAKHGLVRNEFVVIHPAVTWQNRTYPKERWNSVVEMLEASGLRVVVVGSGADYVLGGSSVVNLRGLMTIPVAASLIGRAKCFIGNDSSMIHVAGTTDTPIVGIFTTAKAEYRLPYRRGSLGYGCEAVTPNIDCYGCLHDEKPPVVFCGCRRGDLACLSMISPSMVVEAVWRLCGA